MCLNPKFTITHQSFAMHVDMNVEQIVCVYVYVLKNKRRHTFSIDKSIPHIMFSNKIRLHLHFKLCCIHSFDFNSFSSSFHSYPTMCRRKIGNEINHTVYMRTVLYSFVLFLSFFLSLFSLVFRLRKKRVIELQEPTRLLPLQNWIA